MAAEESPLSTGLSGIGDRVAGLARARRCQPHRDDRCRMTAPAVFGLQREVGAAVAGDRSRRS